MSRSQQSMETILTVDNRDRDSDWSVVWSTAHIPGMDNARGSGARRIVGRRKLRCASFTLAAFITMHCRVSGSALTGGFFIFMMVLIGGVVMIANPLRHFEVYLGQWSISGPGRAFRIVPAMDGIGIAICINAIIRAICCCCIAGMAAVYLTNTMSDRRLPYTYCRDFDLNTYEPILKEVNVLSRRRGEGFPVLTRLEHDNCTSTARSTLGIYERAWKTESSKKPSSRRNFPSSQVLNIPTCKETYALNYPPMFNSPAYNFFYIEVVQYRPSADGLMLGQFNLTLCISVGLMWIFIWAMLIIEKITYKRLVWNNLYHWFLLIPTVWTAAVIVTAAVHLSQMHSISIEDLHITTKDILSGIADALDVAIYTHSASTGTEIIHGKGLNHYASGHIDPNLNYENMWHSGLILLLTGLHTGGASVCALVDFVQPGYNHTTYEMHEGTLWMLPMYSQCTLSGDYSRSSATLIFGGIMISYLVVAFCFLKTALHTIFEYRVKLVFLEQVIVAVLILTCMGLSLLITTTGGFALLEAVDATMTGVTMPVVCLLELVALLYMYRSRDFLSDMNASMEENACSGRMGTQWKLLPVLIGMTLILKVVSLCSSGIPGVYRALALAPLALVVAAVPLRAATNAYALLRPRRKP